MKIISKYALVALAGLGLGIQSCNPTEFLETDPTNFYSESVVYSSEEHMDLYVNSLYGVLYANADIAKGYIFDDLCSDLMKASWYQTGAGAVNKFFLDGAGITVESNFRSNWSSMYTYIRQLNEFFYDYNYGYMKDLDQDVVAIRLAEIRFLRAFAYQELVIRHGGVILRTSETAVDGPSENTKARSTESECWDFILAEYDKAAEVLPLEWSGTYRGRITKGAALGMKARAALYAERWDTAIEACNAVFKLGQYSLLKGETISDYNKIFDTAYNSELILPVYYQEGSSNKQHYYNQYFCAPNDGKAYNAQVGAAATPTDEYASSFDIKVGGTYETFSWDNLAKYGNEPFLNRDVRFYASILYNGATWRDRQLELYVGGAEGYMDYSNVKNGDVHKTTTGYIVRKFLSTSTTMNYTSNLSGQYWIEQRLAEIYLIRSEANARKANWSDAYSDLNSIRARVGMPALAEQSNWDTYLAQLSKERVCELGLEGHRYFDLVRWGKAQEVIDGQYLHGIKITKQDETFKYQYVKCDPNPRQFAAKYNIFPIPYEELKANSLCEQNEVWK